MTLFDTYSLLFRAFYALPPMNTSSKVPTSALYGLCSVVLKVLREQRSRALAFAVDAPRRTFRHDRCAGYKAQRETAPPALRSQIERLPELLEAFEAPVFCAPGFEADDVIASLAPRLREGGEPVLIVSGDRDLLQLVADDVHVWFVGARGRDATLFDVRAVLDRFGVPPERLPSWTALVGDPSDNLRGAEGVGPRIATRLIAEHGSVGALLAHADVVSPLKIRESLKASAERLLLNEELVRLRRDVPLGSGPFAAPLGTAAIARLERAFGQLEFRSLLPRLGALTTMAAKSAG